MRSSRSSLGGELDKFRDDPDVLGQLWSEPMPALQILGAIVRKPDLSLNVFRNQDLEGQVESRRRPGLHERSSSDGIAEYDELSGQHRHSGFCGLSAVVDDGKEHDSFGSKQLQEPVHGLIHRVVAELDFNAALKNRFHIVF